MATKVYLLFQLSRDGNLFDLAQRKLIRTGVKIGEDLAAIYNSNAKDSGKLYIEDESETERLFGKHEVKKNPIIHEEKKEVKTPDPEKEEETPEQIKYNVRKDKMIAAGFVFNETDSLFEKGKVLIKAEELLNMPPAKFGKILK